MHLVFSIRPFTQAIFVAATRCKFLSRQSCNLKIARVNQVQFSVRFVAAISQGFRTCLKLDATKIASSCRDKNCLCKRALPEKALCDDYLVCSVTSISGIINNFFCNKLGDSLAMTLNVIFFSNFLWSFLMMQLFEMCDKNTCLATKSFREKEKNETRVSKLCSAFLARAFSRKFHGNCFCLNTSICFLKCSLY